MPSDTTTYTLTARNGSASTTAKVKVTVKDDNSGGTGATKITSFNATPSKVTYGGSINFTWSLSGSQPSEVEIFQEGNPTPVLTNLLGKTSDSSFKPTATANYFLQVTTSDNDVLRSSPVKKVSVAPAVNLEADPDNVATGATTRLSWSISGPFTAATITGTGVNQAITTPTGSLTSPAVTSNTTYTLTASNGAGISNTDTADVVVGPDVSNFRATPNPADVGQGVTFQWNVTNLSSGSIVITGPNSFRRALSASQRSTVLGNVQLVNEGLYTITVTNASGDDDTAQVTLDVN